MKAPSAVVGQTHADRGPSRSTPASDAAAAHRVVKSARTRAAPRSQTTRRRPAEQQAREHNRRRRDFVFAPRPPGGAEPLSNHARVALPTAACRRTRHRCRRSPHTGSRLTTENGTRAAFNDRDAQHLRGHRPSTRGAHLLRGAAGLHERDQRSADERPRRAGRTPRPPRPRAIAIAAPTALNT